MRKSHLSLTKPFSLRESINFSGRNILRRHGHLCSFFDADNKESSETELQDKMEVESDNYHNDDDVSIEEDNDHYSEADNYIGEKDNDYYEEDDNYGEEDDYNNENVYYDDDDDGDGDNIIDDNDNFNDQSPLGHSQNLEV
ncbi:hypothetical protein RhiirA5_383072 [Rhizophagus irregularis]|uniref:Uncharacterized protein n=1 Tax=Rhizophagus irregularis TaxID=588596 RepID=A0A2N0NYF0_9GLOM|nr:hypothetical protein RhiirA5_383072 [Rhizophagus irregularis]